MSEYLLELFVSATDPDLAAAIGRRLGDAGKTLAGESRTVRYLSSVFVPAEEICFVLVDAPSVDVARQAALAAGIACDRVNAAVSHRRRAQARGASHDAPFTQPMA